MKKVTVRPQHDRNIARAKEAIEWQRLGFGQYFSPHMLTVRYSHGKWHRPLVGPRKRLSIDPAAVVLNYGQAVFEGAKAFRWNDGSVRMFRPEENANRLSESGQRLCVPHLPEEIYLGGLETLLDLDRDFVPDSAISGDGSSMYIRAVVIGTTASLGVKPAKDFLFYAILSPSGSYFTEGFKPLSIMVTEEYSRAAFGGSGRSKAAGNYAPTLLVLTEAKEKGCSQVLFLEARRKLDGSDSYKQDRRVEECGAMNVFWVRNGVYQTPSLERGTILPGITRKTVLELLQYQDVRAEVGVKGGEEADITIEELLKGIRSGEITEVGGTGTAAVVAPIGALDFRGERIMINNGRIGPMTQRLYDMVTGIQYGGREDKFGWMREVPQLQLVGK